MANVPTEKDLFEGFLLADASLNNKDLIIGAVLFVITDKLINPKRGFHGRKRMFESAIISGWYIFCIGLIGVRIFKPKFKPIFISSCIIGASVMLWSKIIEPLTNTIAHTVRR